MIHRGLWWGARADDFGALFETCVPRSAWFPFVQLVHIVMVSAFISIPIDCQMILRFLVAQQVVMWNVDGIYISHPLS